MLAGRWRALAEAVFVEGHAYGGVHAQFLEGGDFAGGGDSAGGYDGQLSGVAQRAELG